MNKESSAVETMCKIFEDTNAPTMRSFRATVVCNNGIEIPNIEAHVFLAKSRGAIRPPSSENLALLVAGAKTLRRSQDESWEIVNACKVDEYLEFDIRRIQKVYNPPYFPFQNP